MCLLSLFAVTDVLYVERGTRDVKVVMLPHSLLQYTVTCYISVSYILWTLSSILAPSEFIDRTRDVAVAGRITANNGRFLEMSVNLARLYHATSQTSVLLCSKFTETCDVESMNLSTRKNSPTEVHNWTKPTPTIVKSKTGSSAEIVATMHMRN